MRILALAATAVVAPQLIMRARTAGRIHPATSPRLQSADAALVLGARVWPDGRPSRFLRERVEAAALLYHSGLVTTVILSGSNNNREGLDETAAMFTTATTAGVDESHLIVDGQGHTTSASAAGVARMGGMSSVIVVSQEFHLPRAVWLCQRQGMTVQGAHPPVSLHKHSGIGYARELAASWKAVVGDVRSLT